MRQMKQPRKDALRAEIAQLREQVESLSRPWWVRLLQWMAR